MPGEEEIRQRMLARAQQRTQDTVDSYRRWAAAGIRGGSALIPGAIPGAIAGFLGETAAQTIEPRESYNPYQIGMQTALGAIPFGRTASIGRGAVKGGVMGGAGTIATQQAEEGLHVPTAQDLKWAGVGTGVGAVGGAISGRLQQPKPVPAPAPTPPGRSPAVIGDVSDVRHTDDLRRSTLAEFREYNRNPRDFTPRRAQALADGLTKHIGTPNALAKAEEILGTLPARDRTRTEGVLVGQATDPLSRGARPVELPQRDPAAIGRTGEEVQRRGLENVDQIPGTRPPGTYFRPTEPEAPPVKPKRGGAFSPRTQGSGRGRGARAPFAPPETEIPTAQGPPPPRTQVRALGPVQDIAGTMSPAPTNVKQGADALKAAFTKAGEKLGDDTGAVGGDIGPLVRFRSYMKDWNKSGMAEGKPPTISSLEAWRRKLFESGRDHNTIDSSIRSAFKAGVDPTQFDNIESLAARVSGDSNPRPPSGRTGRQGFWSEIGQVGDIPGTGSRRVQGESFSPEESGGSSGRGRGESWGDRRANVDRARKYEALSKEWRRKVHEIDDEARSEDDWGDLTTMPTQKEVDGWRAKMIEEGNEPAAIESALTDSFRRGINPWMSDGLYELGEYLRDIKKGNVKPAAPEEATPSPTKRKRAHTPEESEIIKGRIALRRPVVERIVEEMKDIKGTMSDAEYLTTKWKRVNEEMEALGHYKDGTWKDDYLTSGEMAFNERVGQRYKDIMSGNVDKPSRNFMDYLKDEIGAVGDVAGVRAARAGGEKPLEEFAPASSKQLDRADKRAPGFAQSYRDWVNARTATKIEGVLKKREFADLDKEGMDGIFNFQQGIREGRYKEISDYFDNKHGDLREAGVKLGFKENYLPQLWDNPADEIMEVTRRLGLKPRFALESVIENYKKGIELGLKPKFKTISDLVGWYEQTANKALADRKFFNWVVDNEMIRPGSKAPRDGSWAPLSAAHFPVQKFKTGAKEYTQDLWAPKDLAGIINNYLEPPRGEMLQKVADIASTAKNFALSAGIPGTAVNAHGFNILARNMMARGVARGGAEMLHYMVNPRAAFEELSTNLDQAPFFVKHGLTLTTEGFEFGEDSVRTLTQKLDPEKFPITAKILNPLTEVQKKVAEFNSKYFERGLFQQVLPALKLKHAQQFYKELIAKGMSETAAARNASEMTNNLYGGINWEAMGRSRELQNWMRTLVLAPDWAETNIKIGQGLGQALKNPNTPQGKIYQKVALNLLGVYAAANVINMATAGHPMWDNEPGHALDIYLGHSTSERMRWFRPFGTAADFARLPVDTLSSALSGDLGGASRILKNRASLPTSAAASLIWNVDDFGNPIFGNDKFGRKQSVGKQAAGALGEVADVVVPPYVQGPFSYATGQKGIEESIGSSVESPLRYSYDPNSRNSRTRTRSRTRSR